MKLQLHTLFRLHLLLLLLFPLPSHSDSPCRDQCGTVPVHYPFGIDDGCGAPQFRHMFTCNTTSLSLFFITPNGNYKVQSIDYKAQTMTVYDPDMSTCTILQPHHDVVLTDIQYAIIPPSPDTIFALLNCSVDSPILHRYRSFCFDLPGHQCQDLYSSCNSFKAFISTPDAPNNFTSPSLYFGTPDVSNNFPPENTNMGSTSGTASGFGTPSISNNFPPGKSNVGPTSGASSGYSTPGVSSNFSPPPCCFTGYSTVKVMSMDILDCTHFTSFYDTDKLKGVGPMDWLYGLKFSYSVPDMGCERCAKSGGSCGYDAETEALLCLCSAANNSTRQCGEGSDMDTSQILTPTTTLHTLCTICLGVFFLIAHPWI